MRALPGRLLTRGLGWRSDEPEVGTLTQRRVNCSTEVGSFGRACASSAARRYRDSIRQGSTHRKAPFASVHTRDCNPEGSPGGGFVELARSRKGGCGLLARFALEEP